MKLDKLQEAYDEMFDFITDLPSGLDGFKSDFDAAYKELLEAKSADVAPVVYGKWELRHEGYGHYWECSVCHTNPCIYVTRNTKFCPNCGAKMDSEDDK